MHESALAGELVSLAWIALAAFLGPMLAASVRKTIPDVVWLLVLGVLIGPEALDLAESSSGVLLVREVGLGMLFLLAGLEVEPSFLRARQGRVALLSWGVGLVLAVGAALLFVGVEEPRVAVVLGIAATSTALGTLLPILKESGGTRSPLGRAVLAHGAVGELAPVIAMSLLLSARSPELSALVLVAFAVIAVAAVAVPARIIASVPGLRRAFASGVHSTSQTLLRLALLVLTTLMTVSAVLDLDVVLGGFAAGLLLGRLVPAGSRTLRGKVEVAGYSFLIPVFFVTSGMAIDTGALADEALLLVMVVGIALFRGLPVWASERLFDTGSGLMDRRDQLALGLYSAAGLPIIVAVTEIATRSGLVSTTEASVLVAAGAVTVLVFPLLAGIVRAGRQPGVPE
ncbi:cation:proton antiporter [Streptomonospora wellingtoniae]|uniref:Cation:proton antiporter n=1 Tax=Streptomonospora wellingtoniae TaxID=3075544 RepID=A0ABU2KV69_9ACTN|nr:cation:proton antiporter [Streptomonospora sp. DSM 45055]MDT0303153.1 cation:proton antiporter [Streptomonospora sp. DSM 45055]